MTDKQRLTSYLLHSKGFRELDSPVIVTSGEFLTPFFCNTENLFMDNEINTFLNRHGDAPNAVIDYADNRGRERGEVDDLLTVLTEKASRLLPGKKPAAISGGQRRDWLFSGPVARRLNIPHITIFKPSFENRRGTHRIFIETPSGDHIENPDLSGYRVLHIADLLTRGSSIYSLPKGHTHPSGWLPAVRQQGAELKDLLVVVSRSQGGEEMLARQGLVTSSCIQIDAGFIESYSKNQESILLFLKDPTGWTKNYLKENGVEILFPYTENDPKKLPRLEKFMGFYRTFIEEMGWLKILEKRGAYEAA